MMQDHPTYVAYTGSSMNPIFKPGDVLEVLPYDGRQVQCGDVVLFSCLEESRNIVHRVVALDTIGIRTMGDNNIRIDPWVVSPKRIVGYVARAQRGWRWRRISGGWIGRLVANRIRAVKRVFEWSRSCFCTGPFDFQGRAPSSLPPRSTRKLPTDARSGSSSEPHSCRGPSAFHDPELGLDSAAERKPACCCGYPPVTPGEQ